MSAIPGLREGLRIVATSICVRCTGPDCDPCRDCMSGAPTLLLRFLAKLPPGQKVTIAELSAAVRVGGSDG